MSRKKLRIITCLLLALSMISVSFYGVSPIFAAEDPTVTVSTATGAPDDVVTINISVAANSGISGATFILPFDTTALEFVSGIANPESIPGIFLFPFSAIEPLDTPGHVNVTFISAMGAINAACTIFSLTFHILPDAVPGIIDLIIDKEASNVWNSTYQPLIYDTVDGAVIIPAAGYDIIIAQMENGTVTANKVQAEADELIILTVNPDDGYRLVEGSLRYNDNPILDGSFFMPPEDVTITAEFEPIPAFTITFDVIGNGALTASVGGESITNGAQVLEGKVVVFTAAPVADYRIKEWRDNGSLVNGTNITYSIPDINAPHTVTVEFEPVSTGTYMVAFNIVNGNGELDAAVEGVSITSGAIVAEGKDVEFIAAPAFGYQVKEWRDNGSVVNGNDTSYAIPGINAAHTVTVEFELISSAAYATVNGKILSYNPQNPTTIQLKSGEDTVITTTIPATDGIGQVEQEFRLDNVPPGVYILEISKPAHAKFTVQNVIVGEGVLDLTEDSREAVRCMKLLCGDLTGDGIIDARDLNTVWSSLNYGKRVTDAAEPLCDLTGDGLIDARDLNIVWSSENYGKRSVVIE